MGFEFSILRFRSGRASGLLLPATADAAALQLLSDKPFSYFHL